MLTNSSNDGFDHFGLAAFDTLRAEDEPWLASCYVPPKNLVLLAGNRSVIIFAGRGTGKTALSQALIRQSYGYQERPLRLIVNWIPQPLTAETQPSLDAVRQQALHIFDTCAVALTEYLLREPEAVANAPGWVQQTLAWFMQRYGQGDLLIRLGPLTERVPAASLALLNDLLAKPSVPILPVHAGPEQIAARLVEALKRIGLDGVWIIADGIEAWLEADPERTEAALISLLATLPLFGKNQFVYKLLLPLQLEPTLIHAAALVRHYVDSYRLEWSPEILQQIVEHRLSLALNRPFVLADLYVKPDELKTWLLRAGGDVPREWLAQVKPLLSHYLTHRLDNHKPVDKKSWYQLRRQHAPRLFLDEATRFLMVGGRVVAVEELPPKTYEMLCYLFQHSGQIVGKDELYFRTYLELPAVPRSWSDKGFEPRKDYEGLVDTAIYRIRQAIEPDPSNPVLLTTVRGHGVRLESRW
jgi:DNA-binding winged helix-turn-helix (wHTH) protein